MTNTIRLVDMSADFYYAPQAVAQDAGFFADEGLEVEFNVIDTSKVPAALHAGEADVALCGMWQPWMYMERMGMEYKVFAQLNQQVPLMLFSREPAERFDWGALSGGSVLHTSVVACSPWIAMQGLLRRKGVDAGSLGLLEGFPPDEALPLFKGGLGDVAEVFLGVEALDWLADTEVHDVVDWQADVGRIPWSVYFATPAVLEAMRPQLVAFTRALGRAQEWVCGHDAGEVSSLIAHRFSGVPEGQIATAIGRFQATEQWPTSPVPQRESCELWREILGEVGLLAPGLPVEDFVIAEIAEEAGG